MSNDYFSEHGITLPSIKDADAKENPPIVAKFTNGNWNWYIIGGDKLDNGDYLLYGLVDGIEKELGKFTLKEIQSISATLTDNFDNIGLYDLKNQL